jgi:hypothetical protein
MVCTMLRPPYPPERPSTHCTGGWVGLSADLDGCGKSLPPPGFDPQTVQPVTSPNIKYFLTIFLEELIKTKRNL